MAIKCIIYVYCNFTSTFLPALYQYGGGGEFCYCIAFFSLQMFSEIHFCVLFSCNMRVQYQVATLKMDITENGMQYHARSCELILPGTSAPRSSCAAAIRADRRHSRRCSSFHQVPEVALYSALCSRRTY